VTSPRVTKRMCPSRRESAQRLAHVEGGGISGTVAVGSPVPATRQVLLLVAQKRPAATVDGECVHIVVSHEEPAA